MRQLEKVQLSKITRTSHTYPTATNYWAPLLSSIDKTDEEEHKEANTMIAKQDTPEMKTNKWTRQLMRRRKKRIMIYSGATSHFISKELELPTEGTSQQTIYLPNGD
jgi:hypothetical protein